MVCHLELYGQHYYFGNLKVLTDHFPKDVLGIGYKSLANYFTTHDEFANKIFIFFSSRYLFYIFFIFF